MLESLLTHDDVSSVLAAHELTPQRSEAHLKGLGAGHAIAVLTLP
jgi:hypothetical protein